MAAVSPRAQKGQARLRAVRDGEEEPEVVRAPPEPEPEEETPRRAPARRGGRVPPRPERRALRRTPDDEGAVRAPPDRELGRGARERPAAGKAPAQRRREPVVEVEAPGLVRAVDDDEDEGLTPRARARSAVSAPPAEEESERELPEAEEGADEEADADERLAEPDALQPQEREEGERELEPEPVEEEGSDDAAMPAPDREPEDEVATAEEERPEPEDESALAAQQSEELPSLDLDLLGSDVEVQVEIEHDEEEDEEEGEAAAEETEASGAPLPMLEEEGDVRVQVGAEMHELPTRPGQLPGLTPPAGHGSSARFLTDVIVEMGLVSREAMDQAIEQGRNSGIAPERILAEAGALSEDGLARALAERYGLEHIDISVFPVDPAAVSLISNQAAKRYQAVPVAFVDDRKTLIVAMADPANVLAVDDIAIMTGNEVRVAVASPQDVSDLIARMDRLDAVVADQGEEAEEELRGAEVVNLRENADDAPVVKLVNQIVAQAVELGASDLHLAPTDRDLRVRFRIDGVLRDVTTVPRRLAAGVVSRVKIMAELDIAERRLPQDGRVGLSVDGRHVDLRVVTLPSAKGEAVVMRILDKDSVVMDLAKLGMAKDDRERFETAFHLSHGAVLVTGPTGSGKTTSLYAALTKLNTKERNIITVEDPVEYQMEGVTQVQVQPKIGLTFAVGLRTMVRADPDVIMVGEIRDRETAQIAVESALTGHLVLSTLHTNDAPSAVHRLIEMGIEPFLVSSAIECVLAQRLARTLCSHCKKRAIIPAEVLRASGYKASVDIEAYEPIGCPRCGGSGYRGRIAIYEVMTMSREIRELALKRASADEIRDVAITQGMRRMRDDGLEKVRKGLTAMPEILRVLGATG